MLPEDLADLQATTDIKVEKVLAPSVIIWGFNATSPIFLMNKVRLAMRYFIDYDELGKTLLKDVDISRASFIPLGNLGALNEKEGQPFKLDFKKAKQLLTEAGYPEVLKLRFMQGLLLILLLCLLLSHSKIMQQRLGWILRLNVLWGRNCFQSLRHALLIRFFGME